MLWYIIGSVAALLTMFGFAPQIIKIFRTKSVGDLSLPMLVQFSAGIFLWIMYGIHLQDYIIIVSNLVTFITLIMAIGLYLVYNDKNTKN
ncbi:MAG: SemiSWEET family transporter [Candidatus Methanoperedens sp.]|nr:SemiSWEET family transporter [Candidatus Methanoperedens sp.]